jgi:hypothetical protein
VTNLRGIFPNIGTENSAAFSGTKTMRPRVRKSLLTTAMNAIQ